MESCFLGCCTEVVDIGAGSGGFTAAVGCWVGLDSESWESGV